MFPFSIFLFVILFPKNLFWEKTEQNVSHHKKRGIYGLEQRSFYHTGTEDTHQRLEEYPE